MEKFIICLKRNGLFQFKLVDGNGQTILTSLSYALKQSCVQDVQLLQSMVDVTGRSHLTQVGTHAFCFALLKNELELLAISKEFPSEAACITYLQQLMERVGRIFIDENLQ